MGVLSALYTGVSGLEAQGQALGVIGDNIANADTTGFKASRAEFDSMIAKSLKGILGGNQIGRGVKIGAVDPILVQGNTVSTDSATDLAISGDGYFCLHGSGGDSFTRDGAFHFDRNGYLVTDDDQRVQGFQTDSRGAIVNKLGDIKFPHALVPAKATAKIKLSLNLDSRIGVGHKLKVFNVKHPYESSDFATGVEMYDSQGNRHLVTLFFNKIGNRTWEYRGMCDGKEVTGGVPGKMKQVVGGTLTFTVDGKLQSDKETMSAFNFKGGALQNQKVQLYFGDAIDKGGTGLKGTKQYGRESDLLSWSQNGSSAGTIVNLSFNDQGILTALYSNGTTQNLAQVALAKFEDPEALFKVGDNRLKEARDSGPASIGKPNHAGRGKVYAKSLERSTVDLANQFVKLIENERGFQANAKVITTTDQLLSDVINLKR